MGNVHALAHRVTAISVATLATSGFLFCFLGGFSCNFLAVNPQPGRVVMTPDGLEFPTEDSAYLGVQCDSPFYQESDHMWNMSQLFLYIGLCVGGVTTLLAWVISVLIPPTVFTWRTLSVLSACAAVIEVPIFLIFESQPCAMDINRQTCSVATGGYLNIVSITLYVGMTLWTQCLLPPDWTKETKAWRNTQRDVKVGEISIPSGGESRDGNGTEDETAPHEASPSSPPPPRMNWSYGQPSPLEKPNSVESRRQTENYPMEEAEEVDHPVFVHSSKTNLFEIEGLVVEDQVREMEEYERQEQERSRSFLWNLRRKRSSAKEEAFDTAERVEAARIIDDLETPEITFDSVEAPIKHEDQTPTSTENSKKESSSNSDPAPKRASFWSRRRSARDEHDDDASVPRPVYQIPLSWDAEDIEIPPPGEIHQEGNVDDDDTSDHPQEPKMSVQMRQGAAVVMASLKGTTHALADKVRKVSHREPPPTQKSKGLKFTIIGPDGLEERRRIGRLPSEAQVIGRSETEEYHADQLPVEQPKSETLEESLSNKGARDVVVTHSIPRTHASVPFLEREDTIVKSTSLNLPKRVQSNPTYVTLSTLKEDRAAPSGTFAVQPPSQDVGFDGVSDITPAPLPQEEIPDETLAILADLARLEQ